MMNQGRGFTVGKEQNEPRSRIELGTSHFTTEQQAITFKNKLTAIVLRPWLYFRSWLVGYKLESPASGRGPPLLHCPDHSCRRCLVVRLLSLSLPVDSARPAGETYCT